MTPPTLSAPGVADRDALLELAVATGRFTPPEAEALLGGILDAHATGELGPQHTVWAMYDATHQAPIGWTYFAPDPYSDAVWNLWWIGVHPSHHGTGVARVLLRAIEARVQEAGARVLVIETSDADALMRARCFYEREGYVARGTIPDYYASGEGKVIFSRSLM